jgi:hypothetical protein
MLIGKEIHGDSSIKDFLCLDSPFSVTNSVKNTRKNTGIEVTFPILEHVTSKGIRGGISMAILLQTKVSTQITLIGYCGFKQDIYIKRSICGQNFKTCPQRPICGKKLVSLKTWLPKNVQMCGRMKQNNGEMKASTMYLHMHFNYDPEFDLLSQH